MFKDTEENLQSWSSGWTGGETKSEDEKVIHTYEAQPGSIDVIDNDMVRRVKEPLLAKSNSVWGQMGMRYTYDRNNDVDGVVFSTYALEDITDIINNKCWQAVGHATKLKSGMPVWVVPSDAVLKEKPTATGIKFKLA
jgi:hypothetical protein